MSDKETDRSKALAHRLAGVNKRLGRDNIKNAEADGAGQRKKSFGNAFQLSTEFIAAILVGAIIGYGIDWLFGTLPLGLIIFFLLGFVAGVMNVMRSAGELAGPGERRKPDLGDKTRSPTKEE